MPDVAAVLVPIGGGGLASGVAAAIRALVPGARVIGVEPELAADARDSLAQDRIVRWDADRVSRTIADGTRTQSIGRLNFAHLSTQLDAVVTVSEAEIAAAVRLAAEEARLVVEPSGALPIAAMRFHAREAGLVGLVGPIVGVVSGGNVDPTGTLTTSRRRSRPRADRRAAPACVPGPGRRPPRSPLRRRAGPPGAPRSRIAARSGSRRRSSAGVRRLVAHPRRHEQDHGQQERHVATQLHMIPPAICWSSSGVGPQDRIVVT